MYFFYVYIYCDISIQIDSYADVVKKALILS